MNPETQESQRLICITTCATQTRRNFLSALVTDLIRALIKKLTEENIEYIVFYNPVGTALQTYLLCNAHAIRMDEWLPWLH